MSNVEALRAAMHGQPAVVPVSGLAIASLTVGDREYG